MDFMKKIKAIFFDMDGVLVDAKEWHYEALNNALEEFGYSAISREDHITKFDGLPTRKKLEMLSEIQGIKEEEFEDINSRKQQLTYKIAEKKFVPCKEHIEAMRKLKDEGYRMGVCSNSISKTVSMFMENGKLDQFLEFKFSNEDVSKPKPDPEIYLTAIKFCGASADECLVLEDNENGIASAKASGAHVMVIGDVSDVNYENIRQKINEIEAQ